MPDPPHVIAAPLLAAAGSSGPWANDLFPAVLLLALGAALVSLGAWIVKPPPRPPQSEHGPRRGPKRNRGPRRDRRPPGDSPRAANYRSPPPAPLRRPMRLP